MSTRQWLLSVAIVAHLAVVLLAPNPDSYVSGTLGPWLSPYAKTIGMDGTWQFFAPSPWHADFYEYDVVDAKGHTTLQTFPELSSPYWFRSTYNRRIATMRFVSKDAKHLKGILVPFLCSAHSDAVSLRIRAVSMDFPTIDQVRQGHRLNDLADPDRRHAEDKGEFPCRS